MIFEQSENSLKRFSLFWYLLGGGVPLIIVDQWTKHSAFLHAPGDTSFFDIVPFKNFGFAFSLPMPPWLIYSLYLVILLGMVRYLLRTWPILTLRNRAAWVLITSGAAGNILDRITLGYVRDFLQIYQGYINVADIYIILGVILLLIRGKK